MSNQLRLPEAVPCRIPTEVTLDRNEKDKPVSVIPVTLSGDNECPEDVQYSTTSCFDKYNSHVDMLTQSKQTFYSGVDVELIRQICQAFRKAALCAHELTKKCPDTEHSYIETVAADLVNVAELCGQSNLYEVYARYQSCYRNLKSSSNKCYETYLLETDPLMDRVQLGDKQAVISMCRYFNILVGCIQDYVRPRCGEEATHLVEYLVKPSVKQSDLCQNDSVHTTMPPSTTREPLKKSRPTQWRQVNAARGRSHPELLGLAAAMLYYLL